MTLSFVILVFAFLFILMHFHAYVKKRVDSHTYGCWRNRPHRNGSIRIQSFVNECFSMHLPITTTIINYSLVVVNIEATYNNAGKRI